MTNKALVGAIPNDDDRCFHPVFNPLSEKGNIQACHVARKGHDEYVENWPSTVAHPFIGFDGNGDTFLKDIKFSGERKPE